MTLLIVDDHAGFRRMARALLERAGFDVIGEAESGASALEAVRTAPPQVVLLDVQMPDADGFATAEVLRGEAPATAVVLVSSRAAADYGDRVARSSAVGFISKGDLSGPGLTALLESSCG